MKLAVVGAGAAGTAAAWLAACAGAEVELVHHRPGATELYSGALDLEPWEQTGSARLPDEVREFAAALGIWTLSDRGCRVATGCGVLRPARGVDTTLLDLAPLAGKQIAVANGQRDGWDGALLARALTSSPWAERTHTHFTPVKIDLLEAEHERRFGAYDFACLHDAPERIERLAAELQRHSAGVDAWLLGPWLGVTAGAPARLRAAVRRPVGETTSPPDGPAGARFARARQDLLGRVGVRLRSAQATGVERAASGWKLSLAPSAGATDASSSESLEAEKLVLAVGGLVSGGVILNDPKPETGSDGCFRLSLSAPVSFELDGTELERASTLHGVDLQTRGVDALERVGVAAEGPSVAGADGLFVAGSVMASRPRTALEAVRAGIAAARAALG